MVDCIDILDVQPEEIVAIVLESKEGVSESNAQTSGLG